MRRHILWAIVGLAACAHAPREGGARPVRHAVLMTGHPAGMQAVERGADGGWVIDFEFNDRGRGPRTRSEVRLDGRGLPVSVHTTGVDYFKGPVDETLTRTGGDARWKNKAEEGTSSTATAFYVSMYGAPEEIAMLARALLRAPGRTLPLLPAGQAKLVELDRMTVSLGARREAVQLFGIEGLGFTPSYVWLRADGSFFASVSPWLSVVAEGWEGAVATLLDRQKKRSAARVAETAGRVRHRPSGGSLVIRGAALFDAERAVMVPGTSILVRGDRIAEVGPDGSFPIPADAEVIDARGKSALPGLWDMHVHTDEESGVLHLAAGVTTVRDLGNDIDTMVDLRRRIEAGTVVHPRLLLAGLIDGTGPYAGPTTALVNSEAEARAVIDRFAELGYVQIKVYSSVRPALLPAIAAHARMRRLRLSGHVPAYMRAEEVVRAGFDEIQHANMLVLNFLPDVKDTRTPARFTAVGERAASLDLSSAPVRAFIDLLASRRTVVDPTLAVFEEMFTAVPGQVSPGHRAIADRLPPMVRRGMLGGGLPVPATGPEGYRKSFQRMVELVKAVHDAGVPIVAGTDAIAGFTLHRELELYVQAGIPAPRVLQIATLGAARVMRRDAELGSIAAGKLADLILVDGDPTRDISAIRAVDVVVLGGVRLDAAELLAEVGVRPRPAAPVSVPGAAGR